MGLFGNIKEAVTRIRIAYDGKEAERGLKGLKSAFTAAFSVVAVKQIYDFTNALGKAGAEGIKAERTFSNFVPNVAKATRELTKASLGMIEDTVLQRNAIQAMLSGINYDDYIVALEYASKLAVNTGRTTEEVLSQITTSFITGRSIGLKQAGIVVNNGKNMVRDSIDQMKTKMKELDASIDDPIVKMQQLNTEIENQKDAIGRDLLPTINAWNTGLIEMAKFAGDAAKNLSGFINYLAVLQTSGGDKQLASIRMQIESAKQLEDKQAALLVIETLKNNNNKELIPLQEKINKLQSMNYSEGYKYWKTGDNRKKFIEDQKRLNDLLQRQTEIEGAIYNLQNRKEVKKELFKATPLGPTKEEMENQNKKEIELLDKKIEQINRSEEFKKRKVEERLKWEYEYQDREAKQAKDAQDLMIQTERELMQDSLDGKLKILEEEYVRRQLIIGQNLELDKWYLKERSKLYRDEYITVADRTISFAQKFESTLESISTERYNRELDNLDRKKLGEKRYNKERDKILKEQEEQERKFARVQQAIILGETIMDIAKGSGTALKKGFWGIPELIFVGAEGALQIAAIQAQHFQRGYLGEIDRIRRPDTMNAQIGRNEAVIPGPQYAMHEDDVRAIVNNTANTAAGLRSMRGGSTVNQFYGLSTEQVTAVMRDNERRRYNGKLI